MKTQQELAKVALGRMRAAGIAKGGRARFGSFAEAKRLTVNFALLVWSDVMSQCDEALSLVFEPITSPISASLSFRGWLPLIAWLEVAEDLLVKLSEGGEQ
ncbi:hypothetical protein [Aeromonas phage 59.1]|nr:hypothetical protein [Aeromonas phage 59.1]